MNSKQRLIRKKRKTQITNIKDQEGDDHAYFADINILIGQYDEQLQANVPECLEKLDKVTEKQNLLKTYGERNRKCRIVFYPIRN